MKKYELTSNIKMYLGRKLYQIKALMSFGNVKAGELGGFVESEKNLSQSGNAWISGDDDYLQIAPFGSRDDCTTFYRCNDGEIRVKCGCFSGTIQKFEDAVTETHGDNLYAQTYKAAIQLAKIKFNTEENE